jgi:hypothetical protein
MPFIHSMPFTATELPEDAYFIVSEGASEADQKKLPASLILEAIASRAELATFTPADSGLTAATIGAALIELATSTNLGGTDADKADKAVPAVAGSIALLDTTGNLTDSGFQLATVLDEDSGVLLVKLTTND